jgi:WD40 repeat protein
MHYFKHQHTFNVEPQFWSSALSPNGELLVTGGLDHNTIHVWDTQTGQLINTWIATPSPPTYGIKYILYSLAITNDGLSLITGDLSLKIWSLETGERIRVLKGGVNDVRYVNISSDDSILVSQINNRMIIWDLTKLEKIRTCNQILDEHWIVSSDNKKLVGRQSETCLRTSDLITGNQLNILRTKRLQKIVFSHNGKLLAGSGDGGFMICDFETNATIQVVSKYNNTKFQEHLGSVCDIIFSIDDNYLLTTGMDGLIQAWNISTGENIGTIKGDNLISEICMSSDGKTLIGMSNSQEIDVWKQG